MQDCTLQRLLTAIVVCALLRHVRSVGESDASAKLKSDPANSRSGRKHKERSRR
jgi:hypothetical protein